MVVYYHYRTIHNKETITGEEILNSHVLCSLQVPVCNNFGFSRPWMKLCDHTLVCCYCHAVARFYWFISILIIILAIRCCSLIGSLCNRSVVVLCDHKHPCFRNFDFVIAIVVIRMNSVVDGFFNLT